MTRATALGISVALLTAAFAFSAEERQALSLYPVQALRSTEVTATGRVLPLYTTRVGSRLAAAIVQWGRNEAGEPLDVGMAVKARQPLFSVDPSTFNARVDSAQAALTSARAAQDNLVAPTRKERLDVLRAAVAELSARLKDCERDEGRYRQLAQVDRTVPVKRLEEAQLGLEQVRNQLKAAQARLDEALAGPTPTEVAVAEARAKEAQALLAAAQLDLRDTVVTAPFDGVITRRMKGLGDYVAGAPFIEVLELTTMDRLEADLRLPEGYLPQVIPGRTRVALRSPLMKSARDLVVARVVPDIDVQHGTFTFRVVIPPEQCDGLAPGAFVTAVLNLDGRGAGVVAPQRAVMVEGGRSYVMVSDNGKMRRRLVEVGDRLTEGVIVKSGLRADDKVITGPPEQLKDGAPLPDYLLEKKE